MAWFEEARKIYESNPELTYEDVASKFGRAGKTLKNRMWRTRAEERGSIAESQEEREPKVWTETDDTYFIEDGDYIFSISKDDLRRLKILYCEQHLTINQLCRKMGMARRDFLLVKRTFNITHDDIPYIDEDLTENIDELVEESLQRRKREYFIKLQQREIDSALRELDKYRQQNFFHDKILEGIKQDIEKVPATTKFTTPAQSTSQKTLVLNLSDLHKGKLILGSQMPTGNHYDHDVFNERLDKVVSRTEDMLIKSNYDNFFIINYGDSLDDPDANTYNKQILHQYASGENQIIGYLDSMTRLITRLSRHSKINYIGVPGNHSKNIVNWDVMANQLLEFMFEAHEGLTFDCTNKASKVVSIYDSNVVVTHGNHISNSAVKGRIDTLNMFRMYGLNSKKTYLIQGHLHHYESTKYRRILLPSMCGSDDLAENMMNVSSRPAQLLCVFTDEGLSEEHYIYLD